MIEEQAVVTQVSPQGQVWIKRLQGGACGGCMQQASCGTATLAKLLPKREFAVECELSVQTGEHVVVGIDDAHLLSTSLLMYVLPLVAMLIVVGLASVALPAAVADVWLPVIALASLLLAFWLIHRFQAVFLLHYCFKPQIVRKVVSGK
ncbi:MAG: SoxR reducing system RseC family protein [Methylococcaceae bacterium]|nr:SoxR reducing system RseC family protein [Methylococcaceae bacterium]